MESKRYEAHCHVLVPLGLPLHQEDEYS
jgi:hypothetical protein